MNGVSTALAPLRLLAISALFVLAGASVSAQSNSNTAAVAMTATVLPNLKLQPKAFMVQDGSVSARVVPEAPDQFLVQARVAGGGTALLEIPVWLSSNVKSFVVVASMDDYISGTVQMTGGNEKIRILSNPKPLLSSPTFALGLPGTGHRSASGTLDATIQIALAGLPKSETNEVSIRLSISPRDTR